MKVDPKVQKRRLVKDIVRNSFAYTLSSFAILSLVLLLSFVFFKGYKYLNPQFLFGDYNVASTAVTPFPPMRKNSKTPISKESISLKTTGSA